MTRRKDDKKKILEEEVRRAASETAKRAGENPEERKKKSAFVGAVALIERTIYIMDNSPFRDDDSPFGYDDEAKSSLVAMVDIYNQETINEALFHCFKMVNSGIAKNATENGMVAMTEEEKRNAEVKIFYISFWVNYLFSDKAEREEREKRDWVTMFIGESDDKNEDGGNKNGKKEE